MSCGLRFARRGPRHPSTLATMVAAVRVMSVAVSQRGAENLTGSSRSSAGAQPGTSTNVSRSPSPPRRWRWRCRACVEPSFVRAWRACWHSRCAGDALAQSPPNRRCLWRRRSVVVEGMDASSVDGRTNARRAIDVELLNPGSDARSAREQHAAHQATRQAITAGTAAIATAALSATDRLAEHPPT